MHENTPNLNIFTVLLCTNTSKMNAYKKFYSTRESFKGSKIFNKLSYELFHMKWKHFFPSSNKTNNL